METENRYKELIEASRNYMKSVEDYEHNMSHVNDVVAYTEELLSTVNIKVDKDVCIISAYWHDVGRTKLKIGHEKLSAEMLRNHMLKMNYNNEFIDSCYAAIENHKWNMTPKTNEGLILKDADKLAYLGQGRWESCIENNQKLDEIIGLLPKLRNEILYFEESRKIYDREIIKITKILYDKYFNSI